MTNTLSGVLRLLRDVDLIGKGLKNRTWDDLIHLGSAYPAMIERTDGSWLIVGSTFSHPDGRVDIAVLDPRNEAAGIILLSREQFEGVWSGLLVLCKRPNRYQPIVERQAFGFRWFIPEIVRNSRYLWDVALVSTVSSLISFSTPVFLNNVIDRVVPHRNYETLYTMMTAFVVVYLFDSIFLSLRQYLMMITTNKIDSRLASRTYSHLLSLPMQFFESTSAGLVIRHLQQSEAIRGFLTGHVFNVALDLIALPWLLIGLFLYSGELTMIVLTFSAAIAAVIAFLIPIFRAQLEKVYNAEGERQAELIEVGHGIRAIKSLALEIMRQDSWNSKVAVAVRCRANVGLIAAGASVVTGGLSNLMQAAILGVGTLGVFDESMSAGALVAFSMLSGRVTGPLVQLAGLFNEYQQTLISVKMLGKVMDHKPERDPNQRSIRPRITGQLEFNQVSFRYEGGVSLALNQVSFKVEKGQMIGIVGRSGSGKTTVTRMIQGIHTAQEGLILLNGNDIRHIDLSYLRRNVGIVLQDNILLRCSLRENIAAARPDARLDEIIEASRLAGAAEFIDCLPNGYDTMVEEGGSNFSGGQRQRIAIARTLLTRPNLLIFDEATSALDPDSEAIIQENLAEIGAGRTMIVVSHRLSSLVNADAILILDRGAVVDFAPHATLLESCGIYRHLWHQQTHHLQ